MVKTPHFLCRGHRFSLWSGTEIWRAVRHGQKRGSPRACVPSAEEIGEGFLVEVAPELSSKGQNLPGQNKISMLTQS